MDFKKDGPILAADFEEKHVTKPTEYFLGIFYYVAASLSRFDSTSHILPLLLVAPQNGACGQYATTPVPGCQAKYGSQPPYTPERPKAFQSLSDYLFK